MLTCNDSRSHLHTRSQNRNWRLQDSVTGVCRSPGSTPGENVKMFLLPGVVAGSAANFSHWKILTHMTLTVFARRPWKVHLGINSCSSCMRLGWFSMWIEQLDGEWARYIQSLTWRQREHRTIQGGLSRNSQKVGWDHVAMRMQPSLRGLEAPDKHGRSSSVMDETTQLDSVGSKKG